MTTVIIGLDGAGYELLDPWIEDGTLPNLGRLRDDGVAADMQSCLPPVTCPNWQCYATGKNPGKLGVFWWEGVDRKEGRISLTSSAHHFDGAHFWEFMDGPVASLNLPTSYPPHEINGVHVAGGPGAEQTGYAKPDEFEDRLEREYDYRVHPQGLSLLKKDGYENECVKEIRDLIDTRFDVVEDLIRSGEYEFVHLSIFYINMLQHFYYDHDVVRETWSRIDARLGDLMDTDEVGHLFLMSDHGSNRVEHWFNINEWLIENGYLSTKVGTSNVLYKMGITKHRARKVLNRLGIEWWARKIVPERVHSLLPTDDGVAKKIAKSSMVDWDASTAIASGQGPVYVLESDPEERRAIRDELIAELSGLESPEGELIVTDAVPADDVYEGPYVQLGPDILLDQAPHVHIDDGIGSDKVFEAPRDWAGENTQTGLFLAHGPAIDAAADLEGMEILDIAPTVLHLLGYPVMADMDGTVRTDLFADDSEPAQRSIEVDERAVDPTDEGTDHVTEAAEERLSDLGYL